MIQIKELGDLALHLESCAVSNVSKECLLRMSCGRYYYEVFHTVKAWLTKFYPTYLKDSGGATHEQLRVCFDLLHEDKDDDLFNIASMKLKAVHDIRTQADYHPQKEFRSGNVFFIKTERERLNKVLENIEVKYFSSKTA
ncbi:hypothetical protein ACNQO6_18215 [Acinetobacter calcoaceticus]|uniref:hypothetical protein n=1 Tax=Acinetobacter calcoaceticus TaxID=471 RepID=UPI003F7BC6CC